MYNPQNKCIKRRESQRKQFYSILILFFLEMCADLASQRLCVRLFRDMRELTLFCVKSKMIKSRSQGGHNRKE